MPRTLRIVLFATLASAVTLGPAVQLLTGRSGLPVRGWMMYGSYGIDIADADFYVVEADGTRREVDPWAVLGYATPQEVPLRLRRLGGSSGVRRLGRLLRERLGPEVELRVDARVGRVEGWHVLFDDAPVPRRGGAPPR